MLVFLRHPKEFCCASYSRILCLKDVNVRSRPTHTWGILSMKYILSYYNCSNNCIIVQIKAGKRAKLYTDMVTFLFNLFNIMKTISIYEPLLIYVWWRWWILFQFNPCRIEFFLMCTPRKIVLFPILFLYWTVHLEKNEPLQNKKFQCEIYATTVNCKIFLLNYFHNLIYSRGKEGRHIAHARAHKNCMRLNMRF